METKKKELIGKFRNTGRTGRQSPRHVLATDSPSDANGKAIPDGVYDIARNRALIGVGVSHETAEFAVNVIWQWWRQEGRAAYLGQTDLLIQADGGGANSCRTWLSKWALQRLADETGLTLTVRHNPTSASKWNWIEHRVFCHISPNWAGEPLVDYETVLKFIRTTETGLRYRAYRDPADYETDMRITPEQKAAIRLKRLRVLPDWNYVIRPHAHPARNGQLIV